MAPANNDGDLVAEYDNTWLAINGQIVSYYIMEEYDAGDSYRIQGRVPAMLNGELVDLILEFINADPNGTVLGARINYMEQTNVEAKGLLEIKDGDIIDFLCDCYAYDRTFTNNYYIGEQLVVSSPLQISNVSIGDMNSVATYRMTDIYNNKFWTPAM